MTTPTPKEDERDIHIVRDILLDMCGSLVKDKGFSNPNLGKIYIDAANDRLRAFFRAAQEQAVAAARVDQTKHLQEAYIKFGRVDFEAALRELHPRRKISGKISTAPQNRGEG